MSVMYETPNGEGGERRGVLGGGWTVEVSGAHIVAGGKEGRRGVGVETHSANA